MQVRKTTMAIATIQRSMVSILWLASAFPCVAQNITEPKLGVDNASYVLIELPTPVGTFPTSINDAMAVTGYYLTTYTQARGFIRDPDGSITTFSVLNSAWTEPLAIPLYDAIQTSPAGINSAGVIVGSVYIYWDSNSNRSLGFLRIPGP